MAVDPERPQVLAAGGLVWRRTDGQLEVLLVHRPRYDDWSFPKGKCDPGESFEQTAEREVLEETGLQVAFGPELDEVRYRDHKGRSKLVRYWAMTVTGGMFEPNDEVDEVRWLPADEAAALVSYGHDRQLLDGFAPVG
ncbi:NUDIX hydrolase [Aquihabitans sp. McL0605]|uniref:NUDIX hydrolase n=1 Tax=Aquihabitans sp. McL0605 TaxID=3415671 RepID=UPI003CEAF672